MNAVTSMTLKNLGQGPGDFGDSLTWGQNAVSSPVLAEPAGGLLQTPLGGSCSSWSLRAALATQVACECVGAGGMEDTVAEKGVF